MAYTAVPTYTTGDLITAAHGNTYWRDNFSYLYDKSIGKGTIYLQVMDDDVDVTVGDGAMYFFIPDSLDGYDIKSIDIAVVTPSTSGKPTVQVYSSYHSADILTTKVTIDESENTSFTADVAAVINTARDDLHVGSYLRIDVDVAGTGTKGLVAIIEAEEV